MIKKAHFDSRFKKLLNSVEEYYDALADMDVQVQYDDIDPKRAIVSVRSTISALDGVLWDLSEGKGDLRWIKPMVESLIVQALELYKRILEVYQ